MAVETIMSWGPLINSIIPAIVCARCGGDAHCVRRTPDLTKPHLELRRFECLQCDGKVMRIDGCADTPQLDAR
jgi:hypothetical protein